MQQHFVDNRRLTATLEMFNFKCWHLVPLTCHCSAWAKAFQLAILGASKKSHCNTSADWTRMKYFIQENSNINTFLFKLKNLEQVYSSQMVHKSSVSSATPIKMSSFKMSVLQEVCLVIYPSCWLCCLVCFTIWRVQREEDIGFAPKWSLDVLDAFTALQVWCNVFYTHRLFGERKKTNGTAWESIRNQ